MQYVPQRSGSGFKYADNCTIIALVYYYELYNNQINAHGLIGQSAVGFCVGKPTEKLRIF